MTEEAVTLRETVLAFARRFSFEEEHALQDERLALSVFDETRRLGLHAHDAGARRVLSYAALLHDIGYSAGYEEHHKTSFRLILAEPIPGMEPRARLLVAHVARFHRGSLPDPSRHSSFAALPEEDQRVVTQLGAILRFADGLDRTHTNAVADVRCSLQEGRLVVTLSPGASDEMERWAGQKKARWFEAVFGVKVELG